MYLRNSSMIQGFTLVIRDKCARYQVKAFHSIDNFVASLCPKSPRLKPGTCEFLFCSPSHPIRESFLENGMQMLSVFTRR